MPGPNVPMNDNQRNIIHKAQGRPKLEPVAKTVRPKSSFFKDSATNVGEYVLNEVALPGVKNVILDIVGVVGDSVKEGMTKLLFGDTVQPVRRSGGWTSYNSISRGMPSRTKAYPGAVAASASTGSRYSKPIGSPYGHEKLMFETREEAMEVLDRLWDAADQYEYVTVGDLKTLAGEKSTPNDEWYGWDVHGVNNAKIKRLRYGYIIQIEKPTNLKH